MSRVGRRRWWAAWRWGLGGRGRGLGGRGRGRGNSGSVYRPEEQLIAGKPYCGVVLPEPRDTKHDWIVPQLGDKEGQGLRVVTDL